jgi:formate dehydrogenase iron-sulfur subunit
MTALAELAPRTLIDELLAEQQQLTAVERFARKHEGKVRPAQARYYRDLIPLTKPERGEQYAFAVDLDICTGCKACVSACHSLNGLDENEIWRNIGLIHGGTIDEPYQQTVTTACHHCVEPGCLLGCPVRAYEKDADTGIVRHLDDQCIGCQYCVLKCPYDVPKYSKKRGIVRKCDMCYGRLSVGEAPACVQACPSGAITIRIAQTWEVTESIECGDALLPGAFDSDYTQPTTTYTTRRPIPANARPGDDTALRLEPAHWPLVAMLVLTQLSAGMYVCAAVLVAVNGAVFYAAKAPLAVAAFSILNVGLGVSVLHLGRPLGAWRAFLGLRTSWMSREIFAFSFFAAPAAGFVGASLWEWAARGFPTLRSLEIFGSPAVLAAPLASITAVLGLLGVFCSAMIYIDTHRAFWSRGLTFPKFFGTTLLLGSAATAATLAWSGAPPTQVVGMLLTSAIVLHAALLGWEFQNLRQTLSSPLHVNHRSALIMWNLRRPLILARAALFVLATICGLAAMAGGGTFTAVSATLAFGLTFVSQIIERYFFFTAVVAYRMPGAPVPEAVVHA